MNTKVISINDDVITFDDGSTLESSHEQDCCESHYLDMEHIELEDFNNLEFDLSKDDFFNRIDDYGIELMPIKGHSVKIPGYGSNNGYYSNELTLELRKNGDLKTFDISDCQPNQGYDD